jgi:hypothetical protein
MKTSVSLPVAMARQAAQNAGSGDASAASSFYTLSPQSSRNTHQEVSLQDLIDDEEFGPPPPPDHRRGPPGASFRSGARRFFGPEADEEVALSRPGSRASMRIGPPTTTNSEAQPLADPIDSPPPRGRFGQWFSGSRPSSRAGTPEKRRDLTPSPQKGIMSKSRPSSPLKHSFNFGFEENKPQIPSPLTPKPPHSPHSPHHVPVPRSPTPPRGLRGTQSLSPLVERPQRYEDIPPIPPIPGNAYHLSPRSASPYATPQERMEATKKVPTGSPITPSASKASISTTPMTTPSRPGRPQQSPMAENNPYRATAGMNSSKSTPAVNKEVPRGNPSKFAQQEQRSSTIDFQKYPRSPSPQKWASPLTMSPSATLSTFHPLPPTPPKVDTPTRQGRTRGRSTPLAWVAEEYKERDDNEEEPLIPGIPVIEAIERSGSPNLLVSPFGSPVISAAGSILDSPAFDSPIYSAPGSPQGYLIGDEPVQTADAAVSTDDNKPPRPRRRMEVRINTDNLPPGLTALEIAINAAEACRGVGIELQKIKVGMHKFVVDDDGNVLRSNIRDVQAAMMGVRRGEEWYLD